MSKIDPALAQEAKANPDTTFRVILRVQGDLDARRVELEAKGFTITRRLRLINGFGATAPGESIYRIVDVEWVLVVERDAPVHTM